jgi:small subunit ribosomal protein S15
MSITREKKVKLIERFARHKEDTGSPEVQIALLSERINRLTEHLKKFKKDQSSKRGLLQLVARRRKLLDHLKNEDVGAYEKIIKRLKLRR